MRENEVVLMARGNIFSFFLHPPPEVGRGYNGVLKPRVTNFL
jgi:hypothetical protein